MTAHRRLRPSVISGGCDDKAHAGGPSPVPGWRNVALILCLLAAGSMLAGEGLARASVPYYGGMAIATTGWVTTLFIEPITYEQDGAYYDQHNQAATADYIFHHGIDVSGGCEAGTYPVYAAADGTVAIAQYLTDGYGSQVIVDHGYNIGGNGRYTYTFYAHMGNRTTGDIYISVTPGQHVTAGQLLGYQGNDGSVFGSCEPSPGTHLDWEIRVSDSPLTYGQYMRYDAVAASHDFYTYQQLTYGDSDPLDYVTAGPFSGPPPTNTPVPPAPTQTPGPCGMSFSDLPDSEWSYGYVADLYCRGAISGYADGTFRPGNTSTRAQLTKMVSSGFGWVLYNPYFRTFNDVLPGDSFYPYVETASLRGIMGGYPCGGPGEPCDTENRPYFRPGNDITRAQVAKMLVLARGWEVIYPLMPTFNDVPPGDWAYGYVETAASHRVVGGYSDGSFRPGYSITRAQLSKMLALTLQQ
ncbi:MAG TPA: S-layer homology domain-containing protein [Chloroflexia bacterium]|nr:S-layer homology domain-containing protein [Chloroflexia bacterium]